MKAALAIVGLLLIIVGRFFIYSASKQAWRIEGDGSAMDKLSANPSLKARYRFGQTQYFLGIAVFIACLFL
ncbi:MAG TPA: hypothetical protein VL381_06025 [Rhodocyclaceae bacterium]|nr:hypothetical protein [Rhodocyclaceae bacterium]